DPPRTDAEFECRAASDQRDEEVDHRLNDLRREHFGRGGFVSGGDATREVVLTHAMRLSVGNGAFAATHWIKTKNRDYWRYEMEREGAFKTRREGQFV